MFVFFLLVLTHCVHWTRQHLTYPINYCNMASTCIHDNRMVCASTPDGCSRRNFLDQCDMYEYNCDYGTLYKETYILYCIGSDLEVQTIDDKIQQATVTAPMTDENDFKDITTKPFVSTKQTESFTPLPSTRPITLETTLAQITTKHISQSQNRTISSCVTKATTILPILTQTSTKPTESTSISKKTDDTSINCCNRPQTWETTTEKTVLIQSSVEEHNEIENGYENNYTTDITTPSYINTTSITHNMDTTHSQVETTRQSLVDNQRSSEYGYKKETTIPLATQNDTETNLTNIYEENVPSTFVETTTNNSICITTVHCDRPKTWETTVSKFSSVEVETETDIEETIISVTDNDNATTKKSITEIATTQANIPTRTTASLYTSSGRSSNVDITTLPKVTSSLSKLTNTVTYTESSETADTKVDNSVTSSISHKNLKFDSKSSHTSSWWYPTICKSGRCQRPVSWFTMKAKRGKS